MNHVTAVDLYAEYPSFRIDIDLEQQRLRDHDVICFMFPLYWYSTPAILKEWQDLVLEYGFAYGADGRELTGKKFICVLSAGGAESAYQASGLNRFTLPELLQPLEQTANLTGMTYLPPYALFGARTAKEDGKLSDHVLEWLLWLGEFSKPDFNFDALRQYDLLKLARDHVMEVTP